MSRSPRGPNADLRLFAPYVSANATPPEVHAVPSTLLAVQAVLAKTWIVNDPDLAGTCVFSSEALAPDRAWLSLGYLQRVRRAAERHYRSNRDVIAAVLLESLAFPNPRRPVVAEAPELVVELEALLKVDEPERWLSLALWSRWLENATDPIMPALTLSQAVARVTASRPTGAIPGAQAVGALLGPLLANMRKAYTTSAPMPGVELARLVGVATSVSRAAPQWQLTEAEESEAIRRALAQRLMNKTLTEAGRAAALEVAHRVLLGMRQRPSA